MAALNSMASLYLAQGDQDAVSRVVAKAVRLAPDDADTVLNGAALMWETEFRRVHPRRPRHARRGRRLLEPPRPNADGCPLQHGLPCLTDSALRLLEMRASRREFCSMMPRARDERVAVSCAHLPGLEPCLPAAGFADCKRACTPRRLRNQ